MPQELEQMMSPSGNWPFLPKRLSSMKIGCIKETWNGKSIMNVVIMNGMPCFLNSNSGMPQIFVYLSTLRQTKHRNLLKRIFVGWNVRQALLELQQCFRDL